MEAVTGLLLSVACLMSNTAGAPRAPRAPSAPSTPSTPSAPSGPDCSYGSLLTHLGLMSSNPTLQVLRPVRNWTRPTTVSLDMLIYGILEVDEKLQTVTNHIWLSTSWNNEYLFWNPTDFCGIHVVSVPRTFLWLPDIGIQEDTSDTSSVHSGPYVNIYHNGTVVSELRQKLTYTCQLMLQMFPFDRQNCKITFVSQSAEADVLWLSNMYNDTTLSFISDRTMITQGEWGLISISTSDCLLPSNFTNKCNLTYNVAFERKPLLYVINFIIPLFYLLILDLTSFFISEARGEKMSFKITILLSISVLLLILKDLLPSTEDRLPHIASYCIGIFALVGISVLESMLITFLVDLDEYCAGIKNVEEEEEEEDVPLEVEYYNPGSVESDDKVREKPEKVFLPLEASPDHDVLKKILEEVRAARRTSGKKKSSVTKKKKSTYKQIAGVLDHIFFFFYLVTVVTFLVAMYMIWMRNLVDAD